MTQTIMIIDDEIEILDMLKRYFSLEGYHVITAAGGKEALQKLSKQPDLILLDINILYTVERIIAIDKARITGSI